jgi:hypothetical protein
MCARITDATLSIIPEFDIYTQKRIIREWDRPDFYDAYTGMDVGGRDLTGILYAYYDFLNNKIVVEDETVIDKHENRTDIISKEIFEKEEKTWYDPKYKISITPHKRVSDTNNVILLNDLHHLHGLKFSATKKDDSDAARNEVRIKIRNEEIIINPRCVHLINHLRYGKWNKQRTSYARSTKYGHFDLIDALVYLVRNINYSRNPFPQGYNIHNSGSVYAGKSFNPNKGEFQEYFKTMFQVRKIGRKKQ